jgi:hypothetical protein
MTSCIVANAPKRDEHWLTLAMDQLSVSEGVIRLYVANDNGVLLANLIKAIRHHIYFDYP